MDIDRIKQLFRCDPEAGRLVVRKTGREVTGPSRRTDLRGRYATVNVDGKTQIAARVIWALAHNEWPDPTLTIDHINGDTHDNRISNLRLLSQSDNTIAMWERRWAAVKLLAEPD